MHNSVNQSKSVNYHDATPIEQQQQQTRSKRCTAPHNTTKENHAPLFLSHLGVGYTCSKQHTRGANNALNASALYPRQVDYSPEMHLAPALLRGCIKRNSLREGPQLCPASGYNSAKAVCSGTIPPVGPSSHCRGTAVEDPKIYIYTETVTEAEVRGRECLLPDHAANTTFLTNNKTKNKKTPTQKKKNSKTRARVKKLKQEEYTFRRRTRGAGDRGWRTWPPCFLFATLFYFPGHFPARHDRKKGHHSGGGGHRLGTQLVASY